MPVWWTARPFDGAVITGWTAGPAAEDAPPDPADWVAPSLETLARLLGIPETTLASELDGWNAHNWSADPFARGAYSYVRTGGTAAQKAFAEPVADTLYFAGEATDIEGHGGTVNGAIAAGERAAGYILRTGK
jgi:monoamine oxidase